MHTSSTTRSSQTSFSACTSTPGHGATRPTLVDRTHFHILLNGGHSDSEVSLADQRLAMLKKLLQRTHEEEALVGATVTDVFAEHRVHAIFMSHFPPLMPIKGNE